MNRLKTVMLLATLTAILVGIGQLAGGTNGALVAFGIACAMNFVSYWWSDKIVLAIHGAHEIGEDELPRLHAIVERLAAEARIPKPRIYLMQDRSANAFATGRNPKHAAVAVTSGILEVLDDRELEGVLAHELSHVLNRDILIGTIAASLAGGVSLLANMLQWGMMWGGGRSRDDRGNGNPLGILGLLLAIIVAPFVAMLVQLAVSRSREYDADATGARLCGHPEELASALAKISRVDAQVPLRTATSGTAHMFISNPFGSVSSWFSTHPPTEERIQRLLAMRDAGVHAH
jgi:heat shock protein HtpX